MKMQYKLKINTLDNGETYCLPSHYLNTYNKWVEVPFLFGCFLIGNEQVTMPELYSWAYDEQKELIEKGCDMTAKDYQLFADHIFEVIESNYLKNVYPM